MRFRRPTILIASFVFAIGCGTTVTQVGSEGLGGADDGPGGADGTTCTTTTDITVGVGGRTGCTYEHKMATLIFDGETIPAIVESLWVAPPRRYKTRDIIPRRLPGPGRQRRTPEAEWS